MININITDLVPYLTHFVLFKNIKKKNSFKFQSSVTDDRSEKGRIKMDWHTVPDSSRSLAQRWYCVGSIVGLSPTNDVDST